MTKIDFLNKALDKMTKVHVFIAVLVTIILISTPAIITTLKAGERDKQLDSIEKTIAENQKTMIDNQNTIMTSLEQTNWSIMTILSGNNNNLTLSSSKDIIKATLTSSKYRILKDVEGIIVRNHVKDSIRQIVIKEALKIRIDNYYNADYSSMARLYYNNYQLSTIWDYFDREELLNKIYKIIFNPNYNSPNKLLLLEDISNEINNEFDGYIELANRQLNDMKIKM